MTDENLLTLEEVAQACGIKTATIYSYIKQGLLPRPLRLPNKIAHRGVIVKYDPEVVERIKKIRSLLQEVRSLEEVKKMLHITPEEKKNKILKLLDALKKKTETKSFDSPDYKKLLDSIYDTSKSACTTGGTITIQKIEAPLSSKKK